MSEDPATAPRPLWHWILLGLAPGLVSDVMSLIAGLTVNEHDSPLGSLGAVMLAGTIIMPLVGLVYLLFLSRRYARAGGQALGGRWLFMLTFVFLNTFLWGAGCTFPMSRMSFH